MISTEHEASMKMAAAMLISGTIGWFVLQIQLPVPAIVFWRCVFGAVALAFSCCQSGVFRELPSRRELLLAICGGVAMVVNWLLLFAAFSRASVSIATAVYNVQPFVLLFLGALLFGEPVTRAKLGWLAVAFSGMCLIVAVGADEVGSEYVTGIALALGAAVCWAASAIIAKRLADLPPQLLVLIHVLVGTVMLLPFVDFQSLPRDAPTWCWLLVIGVVHTGIVFVLMYDAIQKLPIHLQGALTYLNPVSALGVDVFALGSRLLPGQFVGVAAILLAATGMNGLLKRWLGSLSAWRPWSSQQ